MQASSDVEIYVKSHLPTSTSKSNGNAGASLHCTFADRSSVFRYIFMTLGILLMLHGLYFLALTHAPWVCYCTVFLELIYDVTFLAIPGTIHVAS